MGRVLTAVPIAGVIVFIIAAKVFSPDALILKAMLAAILAADGLVFFLTGSTGRLSPIHKGMAVFVLLAAPALWVWPAGAGQLIVRYPASMLYLVLFFMAIGPLILGWEVFTMYFARKTTPKAVWGTDVFVRINRHLTGMWAVLFLLAAISGVVPGVFGLHGPVSETVFEGLLPAALMIGVGLPAIRRYPAYYQRRLGLTPIGDNEMSGASHPQPDPGTTGTQPVGGKAQNGDIKKEAQKMADKPVIVALNGSPHGAMGSTSMMIEMLRKPLAEQSFDLQVIHLTNHEIAYCTGCGLCIEKGKCWINDDHRGIVTRLLAADGIVLASPVYFMNVTAQMKTFIDRSLGFGHKPRTDWKPGLAVSVSAGLGETEVVHYLAQALRFFGTFSAGTLTAMAFGPGEFVGKEHVAARAVDLAGDLSRAIKEKRLYPATDMDLRFYQFMGRLVEQHKDTMTKHDDQYWQEQGLYEGFEKYVQQKTAEIPFDRQARDAWIQSMIAAHKAKKKGEPSEHSQEPGSATGPRAAKTCKELLRMMPLGFQPEGADGFSAVYQFQVSGSENFVAHLRIADGTCTFHEGPADNADTVIKTPADVWLAIAGGELDGQQAFMSGKYTVEGDLSLLMRLPRLFAR